MSAFEVGEWGGTHTISREAVICRRWTRRGARSRAEDLQRRLDLRNYIANGPDAAHAFHTLLTDPAEVPRWARHIYVERRGFRHVVIATEQTQEV